MFVLPARKKSRYTTNVLVVYCLGNDRLGKRLDDMLKAVELHGFRDIIFITSKWDLSAVTGSNYERFQKILKHMYRRPGYHHFSFILLSTHGISEIPLTRVF